MFLNKPYDAIHNIAHIMTFSIPQATFRPNGFILHKTKQQTRTTDEKWFIQYSRKIYFTQTRPQQVFGKILIWDFWSRTSKWMNIDRNYNLIFLQKLPGGHAGFVTNHAVLIQQDVWNNHRIRYILLKVFAQFIR